MREFACDLARRRVTPARVRHGGHHSSSSSNSHDRSGRSFTSSFVLPSRAVAVGMPGVHCNNSNCSRRGRRQASSSLCEPWRILFFALLLLVTLMTSGARATMTFDTPNVVQASRYQTVQIVLNSNPVAGDVPIVNNDRIYLIPDDSGSLTSCPYDLTRTTNFAVSAQATSQTTGQVIVPITSEVLSTTSATNRYAVCYMSLARSQAILVRRATGGERDLLIWPQIYSAFTLSPAQPAGGAGPVRLSVTQNAQSGRPSNAGLTNGYTVFLVPCGTAQSNCASVDSLVMSCATTGAALFSSTTSASAAPAGVITLQSLRGQGSESLSGTFVVPYVPSTAGYFICVPYCAYGDGAGSRCTGGTAMSYAALVRTQGTSTLNFLSANPTLYTTTPSPLQAREEATLSFAGSDLSASDQVKVIRADQACDAGTAMLLPNLELRTLQAASPSRTSVTFVLTSLITSPVQGRVCYKRGEQPWAAVYRSAGSPAADFVIDVLQPTGFTMAPTQATVGERFTLSFLGSGLNSATDSVFLSSTSSATNPCSVTSGAGVFPCTLTGNAGPQCTLRVDPSTNDAMTLAVCYRKSGQSNYAMINGVVTLAARNPIYAITPYPMFAGQAITMRFSGIGLSASDRVLLLDTPAGQAVDCESGSSSSMATLSYDAEEAAGTTYRYFLVGRANACLTVCYRRASSADWVVVRDGTQGRTALVSTCAAANLYIAPIPLRYTFATFSTSTATPAVTTKETVMMRFDATTPVSNALQAYTAAPLAVKLIQATDACVFTGCVANGATACRQELRTSQDYAGPVRETTRQAAMMAGAAAGTSYIVCVQVQSGAAFVPLLPITAPSDTATTFSFTIAAANPTLQSRQPSLWRVAMVNVSTTFAGSGLSATNDQVYPLLGSAMLATEPVPVCPSPDTSPAPTPAIRPHMRTAASSATQILVDYSRLNGLSDGAQVYLCYQWSFAGARRMSYVGRATIAAAIPNALEWVSPSAGGTGSDSTAAATPALHAGDAYTVRFSSSTSNSLSAAQDGLYFYVFNSVTNQNCFCYAADCTAGTRREGGQDGAGFLSTASTDLYTTYFSPLGFDNYGSNAYYVLCYRAASLAGVDTYVGRLPVSMAHPTYYKASGALNGQDEALRVGSPIAISAYSLCVKVQADCAPLTTADEMVLIPSTSTCAALNPTSGLRDDIAEKIGTPVVDSDGATYTQRFAIAQAGQYRVCYRRYTNTGNSGNAFDELVFGTSFVRQPLTIVAADPASFTSIPALPSAGEVVNIQLDCSATLCTSCEAVRLVPGVQASCWTDVPGTITSQSCLAVTLVEFANVMLNAGSYTVCYGSGTSLETSRRVPGTLTISQANPSSYGPIAGEDNRIFTNQMTDYVIHIDGQNLRTTDTVFLLPALGYTCHDLRTGTIQRNNTLASWLAPSITPYPLQLSDTGVMWVVSNRNKLFGLGLLQDESLCGTNNNAGASCAMQLCYMRDGTTWAPVALSTGQQPLQLVRSNPSSAAFAERTLIVGMYTMVTVTGIELQSTYYLNIHSGSCDGPAVTRLVGGSGVVDASATQWIGVLRILSTASSYAVCFWRNGVAAEILVLSFANVPTSTVVIQPSPLYYLLNSNNFTTNTGSSGSGGLVEPTWLQYMELIVGATFTAGSGADVQAPALMQLITADITQAECNYQPFFSLAARMQVNPASPFPVVATLSQLSSDTRYFQARLTMPPATYALCVNITNVGLFRVVRATPSVTSTSADDAITLAAADPAVYTSLPASPMPGQVVTLTFRAPTTSSTTSSVPGFTTRDTVEIIDGTLYECGFHNATTTIAAGTVSEVTPQGSTASAALTIPDTLDPAYIDGKGLTVCYHAASRTAATVADNNGLLSGSLFLTARRPTRWTSSPSQVEVTVPFTITFVGLSSQPDYFTTSDVAFLVPYTAPTRSTTTSAVQHNGQHQQHALDIHKGIDKVQQEEEDIERGIANEASEPIFAKLLLVGLSARDELCNPTRAVATSTTIALVGGNAVWSVPANAVPSTGNYAVCYTASRNQVPIYVNTPAYITVYPQQSPYAAHVDDQSGNIATIYSGQRFHLRFDTDIALQPQLDTGNGGGGDLTVDLVRITSDLTCSNALSAEAIAEVPASLGYKALQLINSTTSLPVPYLHLVLRTGTSGGTYYVCMRRAGRQPGEVFYNFDVVGTINTPATLSVMPSPIASFTTTPSNPRGWVPSTAVQLSLSSPYNLNSFSQIFFAPYTGSTTGTSASDELANDNCYRPTASDAANPSTTPLLNTTLQVGLSNLLTTYPFPGPGNFVLCYQLVSSPGGGSTSNVVASSYPSQVTVLNPSPIAYTVPDVVSTQVGFSLGLIALDGIFTSSQSHRAQLYGATQRSALPLDGPPPCTNVNPPSGGTTSFTTFNPISPTQATVTPLIVSKGYYYVCFLTAGQTQYLAVPNRAGGYVFAVGLSGAQQYTLQPSVPRMGQQLHMTITGNNLGAADRVKLVTIGAAAAMTPSPRDDYSSACTASATNADASELRGAAGSIVQPSTPLLAHYYPIVNASGNYYVLCYQSALQPQSVWTWVADLAYFLVDVPHPTSYTIAPDPLYATQAAQLTIRDRNGLLSAADAIKLVARRGTTSRNGFDCTRDAPTSDLVGLIGRDAGASDASQNVFRLCGTAVTQVTVCYALANTDNAWAEVPLSLPPPTYRFDALSLRADVFTGPTLLDLQKLQPTSLPPRPYEPFAFSFTSSNPAVGLRRVAFAQDGAAACATNVVYTTPLNYSRLTTLSNSFAVVLPRPGDYRVYLGTTDSPSDPYIYHSTMLTVGLCDPCSISPPYAYLPLDTTSISTITLRLPSRTGNSLALGDKLRLFIYTQGLQGTPCEQPTGAFADITLSPASLGAGGSSASFALPIDATRAASSYAGAYYVCYAKASASGGTGEQSTGPYAVVTNEQGDPVFFSLYTGDVFSATSCPSGNTLSAMETVIYNLTMAQPARYPDAAFTRDDVLALVSTEELAATESCRNFDATTQRAQRATLESYTRTQANWYLTLLDRPVSTTYHVCYKGQYDSIYRDLSTLGLVTVGPANPIGFYTTPAVILPDSTDVTVTITGNGLSSRDDVYVVAADTSCLETCAHAVQPAQWTDTPHTTEWLDASTVRIRFAAALPNDVTLGICYRRTNFYLTRLGDFHVGQPNPASYTTDFVPRVGTRPTLRFTGTALTNQDGVILVASNTNCAVGNAIATGVQVAYDTSGQTWTNFTLALVGGVAGSTDYIVCYRRSLSGGYVAVNPVMTVQPGGPTRVLSSNNVIRGRATSLFFEQTTQFVVQVNDEAYVACPGCSCYDDINATLPYGTPRIRATQASIAAVTMRVGFDEQLSYPVCYKIFDSGFALVDTVLPTLNEPRVLQIAPVPTHQGQRLSYNFTTTTTNMLVKANAQRYVGEPLSAEDHAMLVTQSRGCWDTPEMRPDGVIIGDSPVSLIVAQDATRNAVTQWQTQVPSLGPHAASPSLFPLAYLLCYRAAGQAEYLAVPYPALPAAMTSADPASFTSTPTILTQGMIDATIRFANAQSGDEAYAVQVTTETLQTDRACDMATGSGIAPLWPRASAYPSYTLSIPGAAAVSASRAILCYIRAGATVAEVPQYLAIAEGNPRSYAVNVDTSAGGVARLRQYLTFTFTGTDLRASEDSVVFTEQPCANAPRPLKSTSALVRLGDMTSVEGEAGTRTNITAQFISPNVPLTLYVCYYRAASQVWSEVGAALTLTTPQPLRVTLLGDSTSSPQRVGQHIALILDGTSGATIEAAAILSGSTTGSGTWCHNFTSADVKEPGLTVTSSVRLDVATWEQSEAARLCVHMGPIALLPWSDVATDAVTATLPPLQPANPSGMTVYPSVPRVGQRVTLTFQLIVAASASDLVRITHWSVSESCASAAPVFGFASEMPVDTIVDAQTTQITLTDQTDPLSYRSFNTSGLYRVCYYAAAEQTWSTVGGTMARGTLTIADALPADWALYSGTLQVGMPFALEFADSSTSAALSLQDVAWLAPTTQSCGVDPLSCPRCVLFTWDTTHSTQPTALLRTNVNTSVIAGDHNVCYRLRDATAALLTRPLTLALAPIECVVNNTVTIGQRQQIVFRKHADEAVTGDSWRVSFFATSANDCAQRYVPAFPAARATLQEITSTTVAYSVEWPVSMMDGSYTLCYTHNGITSSVCTCDQVDGKTGTCFIETRTGAPQNFTATPQPSYVGQSITLDLKLNATTSTTSTGERVIVQDIAFVAYVNELTSCADAIAFTPLEPQLQRRSDLEYTYSFRYPYTEPARTLLVCARTSASPGTIYSRVGSPATNDVLDVRPYLTLTTFPAAGQYLRAMMTVSLTFTMTSTQADDVVSLQDSITFVSDANNCVASYIDTQDPTTQMAMFMSNDTAFITLPALVANADTSARRTSTTVTFTVDQGVGTHVVCYKLKAGTWAPVLPTITVAAAPFVSCRYTLPVSPDNSAESALRAMQYIQTVLVVSSEMMSFYSASDVVRVVPETRLCTDDAAELFRSEVVRLSSAGTNELNTQAFSPSAQPIKLCYRLGGAQSTTTNWSPACSNIDLVAPTPTGQTTGCYHVGLSLDTVATHRSGFHFATNDRLRVVDGDTPCVRVDGSTTVLRTVTLGDAVQPSDGVAVNTAEVGTTRAVVPYLLLGTGTRSIRLCYRDSADNAFAIPLDTSAQPTASFLAIAQRQPTQVDFGQRYLQLGQRLFANFTALTDSDTNIDLTPYGPLPSPFIPAPLYDGSVDAATLWRLGANAATYREGRCTAAARTGTTFAAALRDVYGPPLNNNNLHVGTFVPYTITNYDPTITGYYVICYQLPKCGAVDVAAPRYIAPANPARMSTSPSRPRRGQLVTVNFFADRSSDAAAPLSPNRDRATVAAALDSCWSLAAQRDGDIVSGSGTVQTNIEVFLPAEAPGSLYESLTQASTPVRSCYKLEEGSWAEVPQGLSAMLPANPAFFATTPRPARWGQLNTMTFTGTTLSVGDRVKFIPHSDTSRCTDAATPPETLVAYDRRTGRAVAGTSSGWSLEEAASDGTTSAFDFGSTIAGEYTVCYRLAQDTVWTTVYGTLTIDERDPAAVVQTPVSTLEGELFTLTFTSNANANAVVRQMTAQDMIVVYFGDGVNCRKPGDVPSIRASPSRTDRLPGEISFQLAAGTRGSYTICYLLASTSVSSGGSQGAVHYTPIWGWPVLVVAPNPSTLTVLTSGPLRLQQVVTLGFSGFGLVNDTTHHDTVRLVATTSVSSASEAEQACQRSLYPVNDVDVYPLIANGTDALQMLRRTGTTTSASTGNYYVCYKLDGGQYHVMTTPIQITSAASPSGATGNRLGTIVYDGEVPQWTITTTSSLSACSTQDIVFYSALRCSDVPYYVNPTLSISDNYYPLGATEMNCAAGAAIPVWLRSLQSPDWGTGYAGEHAGTAFDITGKSIALCYYKASDKSTTLLVQDAFTAASGTPPTLTAPLRVAPQRIFDFTLAVVPTVKDYVVFLADPAQCRGLTAPTNAAIFTDSAYNADEGVLHVQAALPSAGHYYICYSHQAGANCAASSGRECARIVGEVEVSVTPLLTWSATPSPLYATETVSIDFEAQTSQDRLTAVAVAPSVSRAWLVQINARDEATIAYTMLDVARLCQSTAPASLQQQQGTEGNDKLFDATVDKAQHQQQEQEEEATASQSHSVLGTLATRLLRRPMQRMARAIQLAVSSSLSSSSQSPVTVTLTRNTRTGMWDSTPIYRSGHYALCAQISSSTSTRNSYTIATNAANIVSSVTQGNLIMFAPVEYSGPRVQRTTVTSIDLSSNPPVVGAVTTVWLRGGGGMSGEDVLIAVGVPSANDQLGAVLPSDICTDTSYTPRVISPTTQAGIGLRSSARTLVFSVVRQYVLCYQPRYGSDTPATPYLLPLDPFDVVPSVVSVVMSGGAPFVNVPMAFRFTGTGLSLQNAAALVPAPDTVDPSTLCTPSSTTTVVYTSVTDVSSDGTTAQYTATPRNTGPHAICFRPSVTEGATLLLPNRFIIGVRTAVGAAFLVQPAGCALDRVCQTQPTLVLVDAQGAPTRDPGATVTMALTYPSGSPAPESYLDNADQYTLNDNIRFVFRNLLVNSVGEYHMVGVFSLAGGVTLRATSELFLVTEQPPTPQPVGTLTCSPAGYLPANVRTIACRVQTTLTTTGGPAGYTVNVNTGSATECVDDGADSSAADVSASNTDNDNVMKSCHFTVTAPSTTSEPLVNYIRITVTPQAPYSTWLVQNSPLDVRLPRFPDANTLLGCTRTNDEIQNDPMPTASLVRVGDILNCSIQGRLMQGGTMYDIVALAVNLRLSATYDDASSSSSTTVAAISLPLPDYPDDVNGRYVVLYTVQPTNSLALSTLRLNGEVRQSAGADVWDAMSGSPQEFTLVATPTPSATRVRCASTQSGSSGYYLSGATFTCTLDVANANGPVTAIGKDIRLSMPNGGSVNALPDSVYGTQFTLDGLAPQRTTTTTNNNIEVHEEETSIATYYAEHARHNTSEGDVAQLSDLFAATWHTHTRTAMTAAVNNRFALQVYHIPSATMLTTFEGTLLYASIVGTVPDFVDGNLVQLTLTGSGLELDHRYSFSPYITCIAQQGTLYDATPRAGLRESEIILQLQVPSVAMLYLCVRPRDATTAQFQLLLPQRFAVQSGNNNGGKSGGWSGDDLALLIVGVIFLAILLVLLFILLWCMCCAEDRTQTDEDEANNNDNNNDMVATPPVQVYMPPRANNRYIYRSTDTPTPVQQAPALPPPPPPQVMQSPSQSMVTDATRININIRDHVQEGAQDSHSANQPHMSSSSAAMQTSTAAAQRAEPPPHRPKKSPDEMINSVSTNAMTTSTKTTTSGTNSASYTSGDAVQYHSTSTPHATNRHRHRRVHHRTSHSADAARAMNASDSTSRQAQYNNNDHSVAQQAGYGSTSSYQWAMPHVDLRSGTQHAHHHPHHRPSYSAHSKSSNSSSVTHSGVSGNRSGSTNRSGRTHSVPPLPPPSFPQTRMTGTSDPVLRTREYTPLHISLLEGQPVNSPGSSYGPYQQLHHFARQNSTHQTPRNASPNTPQGGNNNNGNGNHNSALPPLPPPAAAAAAVLPSSSSQRHSGEADYLASAQENMTPSSTVQSPEQRSMLVGPFVVAGNTSRPMVRSRPTSQDTPHESSGAKESDPQSPSL